MMKQYDLRFFGLIISLLFVLYLAIIFKFKLDDFNNRYFQLTQQLHLLQKNWDDHIHIIKDSMIKLYYNNDTLSEHLKNNFVVIDKLLNDTELRQIYPLLFASLKEYKKEQENIKELTLKFVQINSKIKNSLFILNKKLLHPDEFESSSYYKELTKTVIFLTNKKNDFTNDNIINEPLNYDHLKSNSLDYLHLSILDDSIPLLHTLYNDIKKSKLQYFMEENFELLAQESTLLKARIKTLFYTIMTATIIFFAIIVLLFRDVKKQALEIRRKDKLLFNQAKHAAMGEMVDAIAHQWKQPLSLIQLNTDFLSYKMKDDILTKEQLKEFQEKIFKQIKHMTDTLEEFRGFLRPNKNIATFNVEKTIQDVLSLIKDDIMTYSIDIKINAKDEISLNGVVNEFKHVILNLINNSKDAFVENNIEKRKIEFTLEKRGSTSIISIQDNAGGIPNDAIDHIFEANYTTKEEGKGTGIGLYMSKQIIEKLNAKIEVTNQDEGCCFIITIEDKLDI